MGGHFGIAPGLRGGQARLGLRVCLFSFLLYLLLPLLNNVHLAWATPPACPGQQQNDPGWRDAGAPVSPTHKPKSSPLSQRGDSFPDYALSPALEFPDGALTAWPFPSLPLRQARAISCLPVSGSRSPPFSL